MRHELRRVHTNAQPARWHLPGKHTDRTFVLCRVSTQLSAQAEGEKLLRALLYSSHDRKQTSPETWQQTPATAWIQTEHQKPINTRDTNHSVRTTPSGSNVSAVRFTPWSHSSSSATSPGASFSWREIEPLAPVLVTSHCFGEMMNSNFNPFEILSSIISYWTI